MRGDQTRHKPKEQRSRLISWSGTRAQVACNVQVAEILSLLLMLVLFVSKRMEVRRLENEEEECT